MCLALTTITHTITRVVVFNCQSPTFCVWSAWSHWLGDKVPRCRAACAWLDIWITCNDMRQAHVYISTTRLVFPGRASSQFPVGLARLVAEAGCPPWIGFKYPHACAVNVHIHVYTCTGTCACVCADAISLASVGRNAVPPTAVLTTSVSTCPSAHTLKLIT